jgi:hypothetical protein
MCLTLDIFSGSIHNILFALYFVVSADSCMHKCKYRHIHFVVLSALNSQLLYCCGVNMAAAPYNCSMQWYALLGLKVRQGQKSIEDCQYRVETVLYQSKMPTNTPPPHTWDILFWCISDNGDKYNQLWLYSVLIYCILFCSMFWPF